jgi:hypothetical protein
MGSLPAIFWGVNPSMRYPAKNIRYGCEGYLYTKYDESCVHSIFMD